MMRMPCFAGHAFRPTPRTAWLRCSGRAKKLRLDQKGELVCYAVQMGYVHISPGGVKYTGFERKLLERAPRVEPPKAGRRLAPEEKAQANLSRAGDSTTVVGSVHVQYNATQTHRFHTTA